MVRPGGPNLNLQTPIGQMMALKSWVNELQMQVAMDPITGFLRSLPHFVKLPEGLTEEQQTESLVECGQQLRQSI